MSITLEGRRYTSRFADVSSVLQMVVAMQFRQEQWSDSDDPLLIGREERIPTKVQLENADLPSYHYMDPDDWIHFDIDPGNSKALSISFHISSANRYHTILSHDRSGAFLLRGTPDCQHFLISW